MWGFCFLIKPLYHYTNYKIKQLQAKNQWESYKQSSLKKQSISFSFCWLEIEDADIETLIIFGASKENLLKFPCITSRNPDLNCKSLKLITAHRDMHFRGLKDVKYNSTIKIELKNSNILKYKILEIEILLPKIALQRLKNKSKEEWLVLMTCYPFYYMGPAPKRFLVWAKRM